MSERASRSVTEPARIACLFVPNFALSLAGKNNPHLLLKPTALVESEAAGAEVLQVSNKAARDGVKVGMTRAQAETLCPDLTAVVYDTTLEANVAEEVRHLLGEFAPLVQQELPGRWFVELRGLRRLHGAEAQIAWTMIDKLKQIGLPVRAGIGDNNFVARVAAEVSERYKHTIIPEGEGQPFLAQLPVKHLPITGEIKEQLLALGLRAIGQVARFPVNELVERFGHEGWKLSQLARGEDPSFFTPLPPEEEWNERVVFDFPHYYLGGVAKALQTAFTKLFDRLAQSGLGCRRMEVTLYCDDRQAFPVEVAVTRPTLSIAKFLKQLRLQLHQVRLSGGVVEVNLTPISTATLSTQQLQLPEAGLYDTSAIAAGGLEQRLIAQALKHSRSSVSPLPEQSFFLASQGSAPNKSSGKADDKVKQELLRFPFAIKSTVGLRLYPQPQTVAVALKGDLPRKLTIAGKAQQVTQLRGPWQLSGNWWDKEFQRQYFEVETTAGSYLIYNDLQSASWFVQGIFD